MGGGWLLAVLAALLVIMSAQAQGNAQSESCPGGGYNPTPTAVDVEAVPIVVESTAADYFVLYVSHELDGATIDIPVLVKKGEAGTITLAENVEALPKERYRVEKYLITDPADVDDDCIDDITELADPVGMNPVNPAAAIELSDGAVVLPDLETFETLAKSGRYIKFIVFDLYSGSPRVYFINTNTHTRHGFFQITLTALGIEGSSAGDSFNGLLTFHPELHSADGRPGLYSIWINRVEPFAVNDLFYTLFAANMPMLEDDFALHVHEQLRLAYGGDVPLYEESRIHLLLDSDIAPEGDFVPMNKAEGYGLLRAMDLEDSPNPRDVVIYEALPNELSRVAGIITTVPQTPLSHVNLRAVQDGVPNSFIRDALDKPDINALIGNYVQYTVTTDGYTIQAATKPEIDNHYASSRPTKAQTPQRDLSVTEITPLSEIGFDDWDAFGVKAANVAVLRTLDFPEGTVPDGFAIPFYFYDEFMKHNNFYARIETMLADPDFQSDFDTQEEELEDLRDDIEDAATPAWIVTALATMNESFPDGINRRYRSSTNNEDLPGFSGAGLYDSKSQKPSEDEDDLAKSLKEVYASLWNFRAFTERDFHRIDHLEAAMGVLVHPSYQDEKVNGVAVSFDLIAGRFNYYYVNSQIGEDLVTNPDALSVPEEVLLDIYGYAILLGASNQVAPGQRLMSNDQLRLLHDRLFDIHHHFEDLYEPESGEPFAMEIEFKITSENILAIKQARPWVFGVAPPPPPPPAEQPQPQTQQPQPQTQQPQPQTQQPQPQTQQPQPQTQQPQPQTQRPQPQTQQPQPQTQQPQPQTQQPQPQTQQPPPPPPPSPPESPDGTVLITERDEEFALSPNNEGGSITYGGKTIKLTVTRDEKLPSSSNNPAIILSPDLLDRIDEITFDLSADSPENPPAGFRLGGFVADIDLGVELEEGETVTVCLPEPAGGEELVLHHYDEESGMWKPLELSVRTVNRVRSVCTETDVFLLFGVFVAEQSGFPDDTGSPTEYAGTKKGGGVGCSITLDGGAENMSQSTVFNLLLTMFSLIVISRRNLSKVRQMHFLTE